jgi:hypothetical protein
MKKSKQKIFSIAAAIAFLVVIAVVILLMLAKKTAPSKQQTTYNSPIDTTIRSIPGPYPYANLTNKFQTKFKKDPSIQDGISFANTIGSVSFYTPRSQPFGNLNNTTPIVQGSTITYPNIFSGVDLRYTITQSRLLEEFIIQDAATASRLSQIKQRATTDSTYRQNRDGSITFKENGKNTFSLPKPVMYELSNSEINSYDLGYDISYAFNGELNISKVISSKGIAWLNDPSRKYPIAIDLVIDNADLFSDWVSSDPTNTTVTQETTIKHNGSGSVKVQTTTGPLPGTVDLFEFSSDHAARATAATSTITATGGTITNVGGYTIHTFTSSGTFTVTSGSGNVEVLVVAGGGGGGSDMGGGGGGGGVIYNSAYAVTPGAITATVGNGGAGAPAGISQVRGTNGQNSVFGTITATGGGGGASEYGNNGSPAGNGGSGGGTASCNSVTPGTGIVGQGYAGGGNGGCYYPGGGGGAGGPGRFNPGNGGIGLPFSINGKLLYYGGGGGGAGYSNISGNGGLGGGGGGAPKVLVTGGGLGGGQALNSGSDGAIGTLVSQTNKPGGNAGANTGGGGGGGSHYNSNNNGGNGGSGVIIVRYPTAGYTTTGYVSNASGLNATGGTISYSGGYKIHTFKKSDSFNILSGSGNVEVLVVAGGGGGGSDMGGGGGGGGVVSNASYAVTPAKMPVTVGDGGAGAPAGVSQVRGSNGQNSVFGTITAIGGGGGASEYGNNGSPASSGGSGGGTASCNSVGPGAGTAGQGFAGGGNGGCYYPGGGGGAGGAGGFNPGDGGNGLQSSITGTALYYGGGGGGAGYSLRAGNGGLGGGGGGGPMVSGGGLGGGSAMNKGKNAVAGTLVAQTNVPGGNGGENTGGGGGGGSHYNSNNYGGNGGSGIVIVRYPIPALEAFSSAGFSATGGNISTSGGNTIHTFLSTSTFTVTSGSEYAKVLTVGGGGGGGSDMGGGGGAGGYLYSSSYPLTAGNYQAIVGTGGAGAAAGVSQLRGANGLDSVFNDLTAFGGGGGASEYSTNSNPAASGGSGGGAASSANLYGNDGVPGQGNRGGDSSGSYYPGGGGGAGGAGGTNPGDGGVGIQNDINGTNLYWAGGGAGAGYSARAGNGGLGGGGGGAPKVSGGGLGGGSALNSGSDGTVGTLVSQTNVPGGNAGANTGGGGGGGSHYNSNNYGGNGGSGIVIISYPTPVATINTEGSYALKAVAKATVSLNKTLTRTIPSPLDLSGLTTNVTFDMRATRTGSNVKIGLHDSGGTTTEITPNITVANTFQSFSIDMTGVSNANRDAIDQIIITVVNADADNTFYLDNMKNVVPSSINDTVTITKAPMDLSNTPSLNFWVRSDTTGTFAQFQFGETDSSEQSTPITINSANTWEQKLWNISGITGSARNAVTKFAFKFTAEAGGAVFYFDYLTGGPPNTPALNLPVDTAANQSLSTVLKTTGTDDGENFLKYKIELCTDLAMSSGCQTFDQSAVPEGQAQTGWSGQNTVPDTILGGNPSTAYTSGTQATYTIQTPLTVSTTYYWRSYSIDPGGSNNWSNTQTPFSFVTTTTPTTPTTPFAEGASNPPRIFDLTPEFSAIHNDPDGDAANFYQIQVNTNNTFSGTVMWDSGQQSMSTTANGVRSPDISYAGTALNFDSSTYYWRIRFTDVNGATGPWSATQDFTMDHLPNVPLLQFPETGAIGVPVLATFKTTATDNNGDVLKYKIQICTNLAMTTGCQIIDQNGITTGWGATQYNSGVQAVYTMISPLNVGTDYYWRTYAKDPSASNTFGPTQTTPFVFSTTPIVVPAAPTSLLTNGSSNPTGVLTSSLPYFSAVHNDIDNQSANYYQIKVSNQPDVNGSILWDSGQTAIANFANGSRSTNITYAGSPLSLNGQTFYWAIRFWDTSGNPGEWSTPSSFALFNLASPGSCLAVKDNTNTQITISWLDRTGSEDGYYIEKNTDGAGFTNLVTKAANSTSHVDTSVPHGHSYQYRVRSKMGSDYSDWCTTATLNFTGNFMFDGLKLNGIQLY